LYFIWANISISYIIITLYTVWMLYNLGCTIQYVICNELWHPEYVEQFAVLNSTDSPSTVEGYSPVKAGYHMSLSSTGGEGSNSNAPNTGPGYTSAGTGYPQPISPGSGSPEPVSASPGTGYIEPGSASPASPAVSSDVSMHSNEPNSPGSSSEGSSYVSMGSTDSGHPEYHDERLAIHAELEVLEERKTELKSLLVSTEARDNGANLSQDQQAEINSANNPSWEEVRKSLTECKQQILDAKYNIGEIASDSSDGSGSDNSEMFPGEDGDNNNP